MFRCPDCGLAVDGLDEPCPYCDASMSEADFDDVLHEYSKSFSTRYAFRPDPDRLVMVMNHWLYEQPGLVGVSPLLHWHISELRAVTLTCWASMSPAEHVFQFHRIALAKHKLITAQRVDLGEALNAWNDAHPSHTRLWTEVFSPTGIPVECWILAAVPKELAAPPPVPTEPAGFMGVHRLPGPLLLFIGTFFLLASLSGGRPLADAIVPALITAAGGLLSWRLPVWRPSQADE